MHYGYSDVLKPLKERRVNIRCADKQDGNHGTIMSRVEKMCQDVDIVGQARKLATKKASQTVERCSGWLWLSRNASTWNHPLMGNVNITAPHSKLVQGETSSGEW